MSDTILFHDLTERIIKSFFKVYNELGFGFLEKVYENSMFIELTKNHLFCQQQLPIDVYYDGQQVGFFRADLLVDKKVIVELKAAESLCSADEAQLTNYLRATSIEVGLLLNFGKKPELRRKIFTNDRKSILQPEIKSV
jgi:GxxExxY protein